MKDAITKKDIDEKIDDAVAHISQAVSKALENVATKDDLKKVEIKLENRLDQVENRLGQVEISVQELKTEVIYVKNDVRDLKADSPSAKEFSNHGRRIRRLEKTTFASV